MLLNYHLTYIYLKDNSLEMLSLDRKRELPEGRSGILRIENNLYLADSLEVAVIARQLMENSGLIASFKAAAERDPRQVYTGQLDVVDFDALVENLLISPIGFRQRMLLAAQQEITVSMMRERFPFYRFSGNLTKFFERTHASSLGYARYPLTLAS